MFDEGYEADRAVSDEEEHGDYLSHHVEIANDKENNGYAETDPRRRPGLVGPSIALAQKAVDLGIGEYPVGTHRLQRSRCNEGEPDGRGYGGCRQAHEDYGAEERDVVHDQLIMGHLTHRCTVIQFDYNAEIDDYAGKGCQQHPLRYGLARVLQITREPHSRRHTRECGEHYGEYRHEVIGIADAGGHALSPIAHGTAEHEGPYGRHKHEKYDPEESDPELRPLLQYDQEQEQGNGYAEHARVVYQAGVILEHCDVGLEHVRGEYLGECYDVEGDGYDLGGVQQ